MSKPSPFYRNRFALLGYKVNYPKIVSIILINNFKGNFIKRKKIKLNILISFIL